MTSKLSPEEVRSLYKTTTLNGKTYSYILSEPKGTPIDTIFLIHGFPDISYGWRYQIPFLTSLGLRVVAPDMMGYGGTAAPAEPEFYTFKRAADDIAALAKEIGVHHIILGGHDWGGAVVYRVAMYYPELISAVFSVCTPFLVPQSEYKPLSRLPNFKYQIQLAGPELEAKIVGAEKIRQFLSGFYGGRTPEGEILMGLAGPELEAKIVGAEKIRQFLSGFYGGRTPEGEILMGVEKGFYLEKMERVGESPLLTKGEMDFYVERFLNNGMHGPTNWYRTGEINFKEDQELNFDPETFKFKMPFLFIGGTRDVALPPAMALGMEKHFRSLTKGEVNTSHWALWEKPDEVNAYIKEFLFGAGGWKKASL
ncbi:hypothetical protein HYFRA_00013445 [Hymenoscyphus fraxineus]|uniref:AB hydrolase-1 domain-containing protein n=1 Tax=Hymenoscyphus fraxineus TaxID=746836 RepID=A0A9N9LAT2_9HELO|nr:hypothetical protein HYFRA_00013445 [Hymenoscyphus fraxineus]